MNSLDWCKGALDNEKNQKELKEKIKEAIDKHFSTAGEYAIEKFIKLYSEPVTYFEGLNLYEQGIHPSNLEKAMMALTREEIFQRYKVVENLVSFEINDNADYLELEDIHLNFKDNEKELKSRIDSILITNEKSENIEFIRFMLKKYWKAIFYLERLMLTKRGILPWDLENPRDKETAKHILEIKNATTTEISRQFRHLITFLSEVS